MNSLVDLSVKQLRRAVVIKERLGKLGSELAQLLNAALPRGRGSSRRGRRSAATRARMAAAQKARWAGHSGRGGPAPAKKSKRNAVWRAKLAAAARARWKKAKAAGKKTL